MDNYQAWVQDDISAFSNLKYKSIEYPTINEKELIIEREIILVEERFEAIVQEFEVFQQEFIDQ